VSALDDKIGLRHGAGGPAMRHLIDTLFARGAASDPDVIGLDALDDGAALRLGDRWLVFTTDSHVVSPSFFPGGDIGRLAVCGTVNDLAMMGAVAPLGLSLSVVLEEGFARADLERIRDSIVTACDESGTRILTGDTKVMGRGEIDGVVLNTAGIGFAPRLVRDRGLRPGDLLLVTGTIGDHGLAVLAHRHGLTGGAPLRSDVAPLNGLVAAVLAAAGDGVVAMKDPTRGGVASVLVEMARKSGVGVVLEEAALPVRPAARAVAELLGIDPLLVANEGKALVVVRPEEEKAVLEALRAHPLGRDACRIGRCVAAPQGRVVLDTGFGLRLVVEADGELLPRIC
jgi:hydrogenase expression/formation protein HypE